ncbi:MAG: non-heme iron oxygenase ferredoxin subunit [Halioglobus sp.]
MTDDYVHVANAGELAPGKTLVAQVGGQEVLLCHTSEGFFAVDNQCSHAAARLCEGKLKGNKILCPLHGAAFDVRNGSALSRPASQPIATYPVRVDEAGIAVRVAQVD